MARTTASLPLAWLRGLWLFLTALVGWVGFLLFAGDDPAFAAGVRVAAMLTLLGMLAPGWVDEARRARAERRAALRWVGAVVETRPLAVLAPGDGVADLPLPIYEEAIGGPASGEAHQGDPHDPRAERFVRRIGQLIGRMKAD